MSVYQVAIIFEAESDEAATVLAEQVGEAVRGEQDSDFISNAKIAFTKFEKEATEVDSE